MQANSFQELSDHVEGMFLYFTMIHDGEPPTSRSPVGARSVATAIAEEWLHVLSADPRLTSVQVHHDILAEAAHPDETFGTTKRGYKTAGNYWMHVVAAALADSSTEALYVAPETTHLAINALRYELAPMLHRLPDVRLPRPITWLEFAHYGESGADQIGWLLFQCDVGLIGIPYEVRNGRLESSRHADVLGKDALRSGDLSTVSDNILVCELDHSGGLGVRTEFSYWQFRYLEAFSVLDVTMRENRWKRLGLR